jgi:hypothetical protein
MYFASLLSAWDLWRAKVQADMVWKCGCPSLLVCEVVFQVTDNTMPNTCFRAVMVRAVKKLLIEWRQIPGSDVRKQTENDKV